MIATCHKTKKRVFFTEEAALVSLRHVAPANAARGRPTPCRAYSCDACGLWHLTKAPYGQTYKEAHGRSCD